MSVHDEIAEDVSAIFEAFGVDVEWKGRNLKALVSDLVITQEFVPGGFEDNGTFTLKFQRRDFLPGPLPAHGDMIAYDGAEYRVTKVTNRPPHALVAIVVEPRDD
jgi:hypothetical protein